MTSNDDPVRIFIGGTITPAGLTDRANFPAFNCTAPTTTVYPNSTCSYGDFTDLESEPIFTFFQSTCISITIDSNSPVCESAPINLTSSGGTGYSWSGPNGFTSIVQNPTIASATVLMSGDYIVDVTNAAGCMDQNAVTVVVNPLIITTITSSSVMCINDVKTLTASPAGGTFNIASGPGMIRGNVLTATESGIITIEYTSTDVCTINATQSIIVNDNPIAIGGPDQEVKFGFETEMNAVLADSDRGEWSLISGSGNISDINSPTTRISELSIGENIFMWKVWKDNCEGSTEVKITVDGLLAPSAITPNGDGKNDYFEISGMTDQVELIILNKWGIVEYSNGQYLNDWDGRDNKGVELSNDTYFYILKFDNGEVLKGSILIKR
jgi:gliding motility-associated-like protein